MGMEDEEDAPDLSGASDRRTSRRAGGPDRVSYADHGSDAEDQDDDDDGSEGEFSPPPKKKQQTAPPAAAATASLAVAVPEPALKTKIEMLWPDDGIYYGATIIDYNPVDKKHCVLYVEDSTSE